MSYMRVIVCLANSRKRSGWCVAGREITSAGFGDWIRPVSARPDRELSREDQCYENGTVPKVLDIIRIEMKEPCPELHQQENHLIDDTFYWKKQGALSWDDIQKAVESPSGPLWLNGYSSYYGLNDRVPRWALGKLRRSLYLVRPKDLRLKVTLEGKEFGNPERRVRALFSLNGYAYSIVVTDPWVEERYLKKPEGEYPLKDALLCVSLGEVYKGYAYKLAAAVITAERAGAKG